jgi:hypothetical protein
VKGAQRLCAPLSASTGRGNDRLALPAVQTLTKARGRYQNITAFVYHNDTLAEPPLTPPREPLTHSAPALRAPAACHLKAAQTGSKAPGIMEVTKVAR